MFDWKNAALEAARRIYHRDGEVEIDLDNDTENDAFSEADDGVWVRAWVFVPDAELPLSAEDKGLEQSASELRKALRRAMLSSDRGGQPAPEDMDVLDKALNEVLQQLGALVS
mgnify:CR=1 FL=1|jgi:hypothetical protein